MALSRWVILQRNPLRLGTQDPLAISASCEAARISKMNQQDE